MGDKNKKTKKRQSYEKLTKQVRIDTGFHQLLKIKAAESGTSIKALLEGYLAEMFAVEKKNT